MESTAFYDTRVSYTISENCFLQVTKILVAPYHSEVSVALAKMNQQTI